MRPFLLISVLVLGTLRCEKSDLSPIGTRFPGESCDLHSDCIAGFECISTLCAAIEPVPDIPYRGTPCISNSDCVCPAEVPCDTPLFCGPQEVCTITEGQGEGAVCGLTINCKKGLICNGTTTTCTPPEAPVGDEGAQVFGYQDLHQPCDNILDCRRPYVCGLDSVCARIPFFGGTSCSRSRQERGAFRMYFELPPDDIFAEVPLIEEDFEFYRLPFPNDLRTENGNISMAGHGHPGDILGVEIKRDYFNPLREEGGGFSVNSPIFFRFSDRLNPESVCLDEGSVYQEFVEPPGLGFSGGEGTEEGAEGSPVDAPIQFCKIERDPNIFLVNLSSGEPASERTPIPLQLKLSYEKAQYICNNSLAIAPRDGTYLQHDTTYAAIIMNDIESKWGNSPVQDDDFEKLLSNEIAVAQMAPLLNWLDTNNIPRERVAGATVFTTGSPAAIASELRKAVHSANPDPKFPAPYLCGDTSRTAPCAFTPCSVIPGNLFHEVRGTYPSPVFQKGTRPYLTATSGGEIERDSSGRPIATGELEDICYTAAIPPPMPTLSLPPGSPLPEGWPPPQGSPPSQGSPPPEGWPVVIYAHGAGGNFASLTSREYVLAQALTASGFVVISFDTILHGDRVSDTGMDSIEDLLMSGQYFFNIANPKATRDTVLQGSADLFNLVNLIRNDPNGLSSAVPTARLNPNKIFFLGHAQGSETAAALIAAEPELKGAALSGVGADTSLRVLHTTVPLSLKSVAGFLFADSTVERLHPMMGVLSHLTRESDLINYAPTYVHAPLDGKAPTPLLFISGVGDSLSPVVTHNAFIVQAGLPLVGEVLEEVPGALIATAPALKDNINGTTAGAVQFGPGDVAGVGAGLFNDGHFALFTNPNALETLITFFQTNEIHPRSESSQ